MKVTFEFTPEKVVRKLLVKIMYQLLDVLKHECEGNCFFGVYAGNRQIAATCGFGNRNDVFKNKQYI